MQDTKAYEKDPAIAAMTELTSAYLAGDIAAFEPVLRRGAGNNSSSGASSSSSSGSGGAEELAADEFMKGYLDDLMTSIRTQVRASLHASG